MAEGAREPRDDARIRELRQEVERAARRVCSPSLADDVDDIVQLAMIKLLRILDAQPDKRVTAAYLKRVAYTVMIDEIRRRRADRELPAEGDVIQRARDQSPGPSRLAVSQRIQRAIQDCVSRLVEARQIAVTGWLLGQTVPETARQVGWTTKKTEVLTYRGVRQLRACLNSKGVEP